MVIKLITYQIILQNSEEVFISEEGKGIYIKNIRYFQNDARDN